MFESSNVVVLCTVIGLLSMLTIGIPIWVSLGIAAYLGTYMLSGSRVALGLLGDMPYGLTAEYLYIVIPLFVFMGHIAFKAGVTAKAFSVAKKWFSKYPGGLAVATIAACGAMGAACGSSVASSATMGRVALPEMFKSGYDKRLACGCVAAGGLLAIIIPPSVILVIYAVVTDNSVGACLMGGLIPGILSTVVFMIGISLLFKRNRYMAPTSQHYTWHDRFSSLKDVWEVIVLFAIVIGGMYAGLFTPTEAAAGGAFGAFLMLIFRVKGRGVKKALAESFGETVRTTTFIFVIIVCAGMYSNFLVRADVGTSLSEWIISLDVSPQLVLILILAMYIPLGCFLDPTSCMLITLPIIYPIVVNDLHYDPIWFGILVTKMIEIGLITPPVGLNVYTIAGVAPEVPLVDVFKGATWFIGFEFVTITILFSFPQLATWLPQIMIN